MNLKIKKSKIKGKVKKEKTLWELLQLPKTEGESEKTLTELLYESKYGVYEREKQSKN